MDRATLPGAAQHLRDGLLEALVSVGDHQLDAPKAAADQRAQKLTPERLGLGCAHVQTDDLPLAGGVHAVGDYQRPVLDPAASTDLLHLGVQPQVRVSGLQGSLPEGLHLLVQPTAQPGHLILADPGQPQGLHQPIHLTGRHSIHIGLLDHRDQRLLRAAAGLQEAGEVRACPELGDGQLDGADPGVPGPLAVAVAASSPLGVALAVASAGGRGHLGLHQLWANQHTAWRSTSACSSASTLPSSSWTLILPTSVIAVLLSLDPKHRRF